MFSDLLCDLIHFPNWTCSNPVLISVHSSLENWPLLYSLQPLTFQWWQFQILVDPQTHICIPHTLFLQTFMPLDWHMPRIFLSLHALLPGDWAEPLLFLMRPQQPPPELSWLCSSYCSPSPSHSQETKSGPDTLYPTLAVMLRFICITLRACWALSVQDPTLFFLWAQPQLLGPKKIQSKQLLFSSGRLPV